jgi:hypothetical protein
MLKGSGIFGGVIWILIDNLLVLIQNLYFPHSLKILNSLIGEE